MYSDDQILSNGLLFNALRKNKDSREKLRKIQKYLDQGADINAVDANDRNNSPLQVAVSKREIEVVKFLLHKGSNVHHINSENRTALDIAKLLHIPVDEDIIHVLEAYTYDLPHSARHEDIHAVSTSEVIRVAHQDQPHEHLIYNKRSGTSGLSGQLYETKLLSLILLRALNDHNIRHFLLGTNIDGLGAFDDIVFRYEIGPKQKPRIMFIQAKHRDDPAKDKLTVEEVLKQNGDFSLHKYVDSFIKISQKFTLDNKDEVFKGIFKHMDCRFIIYTSAIENFRKKRPVHKSKIPHFINTTIKGKVFQYEYDDDDIKQLVQTVVNSRLALLAKKLIKYILRNNCSNMMTDELIKEYHVILAQHVIAIERIVPEEEHYTGRIKDTFLATTDDKLVNLKQSMYKEVALVKNKTLPFQQAEVESILMSLCFDLPAGFGNLKFSFNGNEKKKRKRLDYLCSKFHKLLRMSQTTVNHVVIIDDSMIGLNEILQDADLDTYRIGGLVGNLLILDSETNMLKFNTDKKYLSDDCIDIYENLKTMSNKDNFCRFRLSINVHGFPKLTLSQEDNENELLKTFLDRLYFYTDQAKEDTVGKILKEEIDKYHNSKGQTHALQLKSDAIYLKVHDKIQNWWKQSKTAAYLTENCSFFHQTEREILDSPLLNVINFTYITNLKNIPIEFDDDSVERLQISAFMSSVVKMLVISTCEVKFTSIKVAAYFDRINGNKCMFMDYDFVTSENCFDVINSELSETNSSVLVVVCDRNAQGLYKNIKSIGQVFKEKVIVVTNNTLADQLKCYTSIDSIISIMDENNNFNNLSSKIRNKFLTEKKIIFQGIEIPLGNLLDDEECCACVDVSVLKHIVDNIEKIHIGRTLNNSSYDETMHHYIEQRMCRYITLNNDYKKSNTVYVVNSCETAVEIPSGIEDVILITEDKKKFEKLCLQNEGSNIHWFTDYGGKAVWKRTHGKINTIMKYVENGLADAYTVQPETLTDLEEKVIIVSAEPGMGKSTLLTHLAIRTKQKVPTIWICKINLLEHTNIYMKWREGATNVSFEDAMIFLYMVVDFKTFKQNDQEAEKHKRGQLEKNIADVIISLDKNRPLINQKYLSSLELLELKIFHHFFANRKVILLLDGFDEICPDYAKQVIQLINNLAKSKIVQLWVTTRSYNVVTLLEESLGVFSYTLQPLSVIDQKNFIHKMWSKDLKANNASNSPESVVIDYFFNIVSTAIGNKDGKFTSIPLHIYMIAEIFRTSIISLIEAMNEKLSGNYKPTILMNDSLDLMAMYDHFVDVKFFNIRFGEKKRSMNLDDPDTRKMVEDQRLAFVEIHKKVAASFMFDKNVVNALLNDQDLREINEMIECVKLGQEKTGIIQRVSGNEPKFVHMTFAEYFAAEFLLDKLKSKFCSPSLWKKLMDSVFLSVKAAGMRRFINSEFVSDEILNNLSSSRHHSGAVFEALLRQLCLPMTSLFVATEESKESLAMFFLKCATTMLDKYNLDEFLKLINKSCVRYCVMCAAVERHAIVTIKYLISIVKKIDASKLRCLFFCEDIDKHNPLTVAIGYIKFPPDRDVINVLMRDVLQHDTDLMVDIFTTNSDKTITVAHLLGFNVDTLIFLYPYIVKLRKEQRMKIFSTTDMHNRLPAHYAAQANHYNFFDYLDKLLDKKQFRQICTSRDSSGWTPIYYFAYNKLNNQRLKCLLENIYEQKIKNLDEFMLTIVIRKEYHFLF